jgi:hypothetical protein
VLVGRLKAVSMLEKGLDKIHNGHKERSNVKKATRGTEYDDLATRPLRRLWAL